MARPRIKSKPVKVYSTTTKAVGIAAKYLFEKEIKSMQLSVLEVRRRSADNIMRLIQNDYAKAIQL